MRTILGKLVLTSAVMAAAAFVTTSAMAEATLNVPFSFTVGKKTCPAGYYVVHQDVAHSLVTLRSNGSAQSFTWVLAPGDPSPTDSKIVLKFDAQGEAYSLRSVQYGPLATGRLDKKTIENEHRAPVVIQGQ